ncbi:hypothetical protein [Thioalkalivibrio nitratireducens]|uniref:hypothetical protein n=1 Tax=Thioalkalivibrio nitratireducens TaxID=186931 RepID=UPI0005C21E63|nr:hypothetical protein [Thioalkalivibrio nitratireducens]
MFKVGVLRLVLAGFVLLPLIAAIILAGHGVVYAQTRTALEGETARSLVIYEDPKAQCTPARSSYHFSDCVHALHTSQEELLRRLLPQARDHAVRYPREYLNTPEDWRERQAREFDEIQYHWRKFVELDCGLYDSQRASAGSNRMLACKIVRIGQRAQRLNALHQLGLELTVAEPPTEAVDVAESESWHAENRDRECMPFQSPAFWLQYHRENGEDPSAHDVLDEKGNLTAVEIRTPVNAWQFRRTVIYRTLKDCTRALEEKYAIPDRWR